MIEGQIPDRVYLKACQEGETVDSGRMRSLCLPCPFQTSCRLSADALARRHSISRSTYRT